MGIEGIAGGLNLVSIMNPLPIHRTSMPLAASLLHHAPGLQVKVSVFLPAPPR
jgi:hypothetical protein